MAFRQNFNVLNVDESLQFLVKVSCIQGVALKIQQILALLIPFFWFSTIFVTLTLFVNAKARFSMYTLRRLFLHKRYICFMDDISVSVPLSILSLQKYTLSPK